MSLSSATPNRWNSGQTIYFGTAVPGTTDAYGIVFNVGDWVINTAPVAGGAPFWVCTAGGSPGTWEQGAGALDVSYAFPTNASLITTTIYVTFGTSYIVGAITETHAVAGTDAGAVTLQVWADASGSAAGTGTALLATALSLKTTANTPQQGVLIASPTLLATQRLDVIFTGTLTAVSGVLLKILLQKTS